jgi:class 3 adenylate cyclase
MPKAHAQPTPAKYVFLDVVDFTKDRGVEVQTEIVRVLNEIVKRAVGVLFVPRRNIIYLPTGDGICIALLNIEAVTPAVDKPYDIHLRLALTILKGVHEYNESIDPGRARFDIRVGVNESTDNKVKDINGKFNMAGSGINEAQRIMSLAEGNQLFVGNPVFDTLSQWEPYSNEAASFRPLKVTVKHHKVLRLHQYVGKGHPGLNTEIQETLKSQEALNLFDSATACGLKKIYSARAMATDDVRKEIDNAGRRIWMLGVGIAEKFNLIDLLPTLERKLDNVDVRIMMLHALSIPALFRTFLEITPQSFKSVINSIDRKPPAEPYFEQQLYRSFRATTSELNNHPDFRAAVRFYRHTPVCWLVIVDDTAYFQPYTFGRGKEYTPDNLTLGPLMPVFKFQPENGSGAGTFDILQDHFNKLWLTSNTDLLHIGAHMISRGEILRDLYKKHHVWFKHVYGELHNAQGSERRKFARQACISTPPPPTQIEWGTQKVDAKIVDFSRDSLFLELKQGAPPEVGERLTVRIQPVGGYEEAAKHLRKEILDPSGGKFRVTRVLDGNGLKPLIALHSDPEE